MATKRPGCVERSPDLVVTGLYLPDQECGPMLVIVITESAAQPRDGSALVRFAELLGARRVFPKSFAMQDLLATICELLFGLPPPCPRVAFRTVLLACLASLLGLGSAGAQVPFLADPPMPSVHRFSVRALVTVDVTGRLVVKDPQTAGETITRSITRLGGTPLARRPDPVVPRGEIIELLLPRGAYAGFAAALARLGGWVVECQTTELPAEVRIVIHVAE